MSSQLRPLTRRLQEAKAVGVVGHCYVFLATGEDTGGSHLVIHAHIPVGDMGTPPHIHSREDETFFIIEGEVTFQLDGREVVAGPGTVVFAPRLQPHSFRNRGSTPAQMLVTATPAGLEAFFSEVGVPLDRGAQLAPPPTPEHIGQVLAFAPKYGIEILPPPGEAAASG